MAERDLSGHRVLVVGSSSGIGLAIGKLLSAEGALVAMAARRTELLEQAIAELDGAIAITCDASEPGGCELAVEATVDAFGGLDAAIYVVGTSPLGMLDEVDEQFWQQVFASNVFGAGALARAAAIHLRASVDGRLVFISSNAPERPWPGMVVYAASKAALATNTPTSVPRGSPWDPRRRRWQWAGTPNSEADSVSAGPKAGTSRQTPPFSSLRTWPSRSSTSFGRQPESRTFGSCRPASRSAHLLPA